MTMTMLVTIMKVIRSNSIQVEFLLDIPRAPPQILPLRVPPSPPTQAWKVELWV